MNRLINTKTYKLKWLVGLALSFALSACVQPRAAAPTAPTQAQPPDVPAATTEAKPTKAAQPAASGFPITIKDGAGRELTLSKPPERVVALYNDSLGLLATIGVKPVAVLADSEMLSDPIYFDGTGKDIPKIRSGDNLNLEDVAAARPDLVFAYSEEEAKAMENIAPVFINFGANTLDEVITATRAYGQIFGKQAEAEAVINNFNDRLAAYVLRAPKDISVMKLGASGPNKFDVATVNDPICQILNRVAKCDYEDPKGKTKSWSYETSVETVLAAKPDVILLSNWWSDGSLSDAEMLKKLDALPLWGEVTAVKNKRVLMPLAGYRNPIASSLPAAQKFLDVYMPALYPDVFPKALTDDEVKAILKGAAQPAASAYPITIKDGAGSELTFAKAPERVVCLYHTCMEYLAALGIEPIAAPAWAHVFQFAENLLYFKQPNGIVKLKMTDNGPDLEQLAQLKPDLVFGWTELRDSLKGIAPLHDIGALSGNYKGALQELRGFSVIFGKQKEAEAAIKAFEDRLAAYKKLSPRNLTVLNSGGDGKDFWITTFDSVPCSLFNEVAKCEWPNPAPKPGVWGYSGSIETVLKLDPDVIIFESWTDKTSVEMSTELSKSNPLWAELSAVKAQRLFDDKGRASYGIGTIGGARLLDTYMPLLYPAVFPRPLTDAQVKEILAK